MPTNIEIKARAHDPSRQTALAEALGEGPPVELHQEDIFFPALQGRLKLRILGPDHGELIHYQRADTSGPRPSLYHIAATREPKALLETLTSAFGTSGAVRKRRRLIMIGQTRVHLDEVEGLGSYIELEVVLRRDQSHDEGMAIAQHLMRQLDIRREDLVDRAYIDLLQERGRDAAAPGA
jgi:predicted adenylyl cyclase CyaB